MNYMFNKKHKSLKSKMIAIAMAILAALIIVSPVLANSSN